LAGLIRGPVRSAARDLRGFKINFMYESPETDIVHHTLKEFLIFAATCGFALKQEIVGADGCSAEGVGLDDIRACLEIIRMNLLDHLRLRQVQYLEAAFEVFAFPIAEPVPAVIRLR